MDLTIKRQADEPISTQIIKRARSATLLPTGPSTVVELSSSSAPVLSCRFDRSGTYLATTTEKSILLWTTDGEHSNVCVFKGHDGAVLDLNWNVDSTGFVSAGVDGLVEWDVAAGSKVRKHVGHEGVVNCVSGSRRGDRVVVSGSDDGYIGIWDPRVKDCVRFIDYPNTNPVTAVAVTEAGTEYFGASIDNTIVVWDSRNPTRPAYSMTGHTDTVSSLELGPDDQSLLSYSFDGTARMWDVRPFGSTNRLVTTFDGGVSSQDMNLARASWSDSGSKVAAGCGDGTVVVWDSRSGRLLQKVPGHKGAVNDVRFRPGTESIVATASVDGTVLLGPI